MALDGICVAHLAKELQDTLDKGRIHKIAQPEEDELLLTFKLPRGQKRLLISANASLPLLYLTDENKTSPMTAPNFCMLLRKHLNNGKIIEIKQPQLERVLEIHIEHLDELGDVGHKILIIELMGRHSNIILCNEDRIIMDSIKRISSNVSSVREVLPGRTYFVPDTMGKLDPLTVSKETWFEVLASSNLGIMETLNQNFTGISYGVATSLCTEGKLSGTFPSSSLSKENLESLYHSFVSLFKEVRQGSFTPLIYYKKQEPIDFSSTPLYQMSQNLDTHTPLTQKEYESISSLLNDFYAEKSMFTRIRQKSSDLRQIVGTALERNRKKLTLQEKQLTDTNNRDKFKVYGELLHTYGYSLNPGDKVLVALNYYTNEEVSIPLDPTLTAMDNAQKYFQKYNKQKRTFEALRGLILETSNEVSYLESVLTSLDLATCEDDLMAIKEELITSGYVRRRYSKQKVKYVNKPLHYISSDGYDIYVGKNNLQNELITFEIAQGNDWWFHAKGIAGSHVVVKSKGVEPPDRVFEEAGKLAAYYSKLRGSEKVEIDYIEKKHVKKPKGGNPGLVIYHTNYSLMIDSDISMLTLSSS